MRAWLLLVVVLAPLGARGDLSGAGAGAARVERCLDAVRRALAPEYPHDDGDEDFCAQKEGHLFCGRACRDRNCHNDGCELWSASIGVFVVATPRGRFDVRIYADVDAEGARARRVLDRCLGQ